MPSPAPPTPATTAPGWVTDRTGATLEVAPGVADLALRRNPRRAHLLVSALLGKHVPVPAGTVLSAADRLGAGVAAVCGQTCVVVGFAETATALGHGVARALTDRGRSASYAHTTRRAVPAGLDVLSFDEEHSHAVEQLLAVQDPAALSALSDPDVTLVLVDDELSTGQTAVNAIRQLQSRWPRRRYVLASLLDVRGPSQRERTCADVQALGAELVDVSLYDGVVHVPDDLPARAAELVAVDAEPVPAGGFDAVVREWRLVLPVGTPLTGAHGWDAAAEAGLDEAAQGAASALRPLLTGSVLCVGDEEFMYAGQRLASALGPEVRTSTTTRSPALAVDAVGYPLRTALAFPAGDDPARAAFAYNVLASAQDDRGPAPGFDAVVLVVDRAPALHVRAGLLAQLAGAARRSLDVVVVFEGDGVTSTTREEEQT